MALCQPQVPDTAVRAALPRSVELGMTFLYLPLLDINRGLVLNEVPCLI